MRTDLDVRLSPGVQTGQSFDLGESWIDPIIGGRVLVSLNDRWSATALADVGGSGGSDLTWQAVATLGYQINDRWSVQGGWRHISVEREMNGLNVEFDLSGPVLGLTARF